MAKRKSEFKEMTVQNALVGMILKKSIHQVPDFKKGGHNMDTVKSVMYDQMRSILESWTTLDGENLEECLDELMDTAFSVCGISEKGQNEEWD